MSRSIWKCKLFQDITITVEPALQISPSPAYLSRVTGLRWTPRYYHQINWTSLSRRRRIDRADGSQMPVWKHALSSGSSISTVSGARLPKLRGSRRQGKPVSSAIYACCRLLGESHRNCVVSSPRRIHPASGNGECKFLG